MAGMRYRFRPMRWRDAWAVAHWRYAGEYAFYDTSFAALVPVMLAQSALRLTGRAIYYSAIDERDELAGVFSFVRDGGTVEVGLGMRPDRTGQRAGLDFVLAGLEFAQQQFAPSRFKLNVATFNKRAITVYERAGFRHIRTFERWSHGRRNTYLEMARDA
jgi:[ribosomal protein S18]-alanine N-acetyltransferase